MTLWIEKPQILVQINKAKRWCLPDTLKINFLFDYNGKQLQRLLKKKSKKKLHKSLQITLFLVRLSTERPLHEGT